MNIPRSFSVLPEKIKAQRDLRILQKVRELKKFAILVIFVKSSILDISPSFFSQSASQPVSQSVSQSASQSVSQPVSQSVSRSVSQSVSQPVSQSVSQSISTVNNCLKTTKWADQTPCESAVTMFWLANASFIRFAWHIDGRTSRKLAVSKTQYKGRENKPRKIT